ncbi:type VII secretion-associated serine protease mycosin [Mycobacterium spongiae]|uniref:Type VII secretion-associated serine protease mycosin n=1 Tax=Mycobacterium spongiae TaxID=886343 RepID=A0A975PVY5_9MYCO|nr:type VII secretion-associated serine protease mycosin [Mycobacterium spongiae]QUR66477.1 type VII secretion-associated serine protease mycosin [Mycobacterium spongiae]
MNAATSGVTRVLAVAALTAASQLGAAPALAISPPPIDDTWLPAPAPPAPPQPTVQREVCAVVTTKPGRAAEASAAPTQLADLDLPRVWQLSRGAGQRVAVIDTGVARHRRLPKLVAGGDYVSAGDGTQDCDAHGTLVAGIIGATSDSTLDKFSGVAPEATVISIRQSSAKFRPGNDPTGGGVGDVDTMAQAVRTAADLGASVINISSVACVSPAAALDDRALGAALAYAVDTRNAVVVAAAGNTGGASQCPPQRSDTTQGSVSVAVSPAWYDDYVLTVGSVNAAGEPSAFTLAGPWVDVAATGESVTSLNPIGDGIMTSIDASHDAAPLSGTSYAAPVVSGLAALIRARFPTMPARQVMDRIKATAHHPPAGWNPLVGNGTVDAMAAVSTATDPQSGIAVPDPQPSRVPRPSRIHKPTDQRPTPGPPAPGARNIAIGGAAACVVVLVAALATSTATRVLRRSNRDSVARE